MPFQPALPTWLSLNAVNSPYQSGQGDSVTGFPYAGGGLNQGDYFDLTNDEALGASYPTNGILYNGRYRYVQVDSGATAANVKTGTIGYIRSGNTLKSAVTITAGSGQTNGTFTINANLGSGGGTGASISVTIAGGVIVGNPTVVSAGFGYVSAPTFTVAQGGTPGTVVGQLGISENVVTSADQALSSNLAAAAAGPIHPVVFLNSITPGNFGFVQESGVATVLSAPSVAQTVNQYAQATASGSTPIGLIAVSSATFGIYTIGNILDPLSGSQTATTTPFKIQMNTPIYQD